VRLQRVRDVATEDRILPDTAAMNDPMMPRMRDQYRADAEVQAGKVRAQHLPAEALLGGPSQNT